jgi:branched-chain amino acid aminotransferase
MAKLGKYAAVDGKLVPFEEAKLSIAGSAVLYGLSVYTVFFGSVSDAGVRVFRLSDHLTRLKQSARLIGMDDVSSLVDEKAFLKTIKDLIKANQPTTDQYFRVTIHATELVPGVKTRNLSLSLTVFTYEAPPILPPDGAHVKTSLWRRTSDTAIPARAKVNGAYVNSALAKQDALDSGCDDCLFLNQNGYVSELSAANVFLVKHDELITPDTASDILEGITRRSIIELAKEQGYKVTERKVALTELYTADEVFACGSSAFIAPLLSIDQRMVGNGKPGAVTLKLRDCLKHKQTEDNSWTTLIV